MKEKNNKGITLIALIITIIVLLILAVVAISAVTGNGIISHAKNAKSQYSGAQVNEQLTLQTYLDELDKNVTTDEKPSLVDEDSIMWDGKSYKKIKDSSSAKVYLLPEDIDLTPFGVNNISELDIKKIEDNLTSDMGIISTSEITFKIDEVTCKGLKDMLWKDWVESAYCKNNNDIATNYGGMIYLKEVENYTSGSTMAPRYC